MSGGKFFAATFFFFSLLTEPRFGVADVSNHVSPSGLLLANDGRPLARHDTHVIALRGEQTDTRSLVASLVVGAVGWCDTTDLLKLLLLFYGWMEITFLKHE